jgi:hypothetical protein
VDDRSRKVFGIERIIGKRSMFIAGNWDRALASSTDSVVTESGLPELCGSLRGRDTPRERR